MSSVFGLLILIPVQILIVFIGARLAMSPILPNRDKEQMDLINLRDLGIITNDELGDLVNIYNTNESKNKNYKKFEKYYKVLTIAKDTDYFTEEAYQGKVNALKKMYDIQ